MRSKHIIRWIFFTAAVLTLPLCCISTVIAAITFLPFPMFREHFYVANKTGETLYLTPIGKSVQSQEGTQDVLDQYYRFPNIPVWKRADLRLESGDTIYIIQMADEDYALSSIVTRNERGEYRHLRIDEQPAMLLSGDSPAPTTYTIDSFNRLSEVEPELLKLVVTANPYNFRRWAEWGILIGAELIPLGLFGSGLYLSRRSEPGIHHHAN